MPLATMPSLPSMWGAMRRPYWRKTTWIMVAWSVAAVVVAVVIAVNANTTDIHACLGEGRSLAECRQVAHGASAVGAAIIILIGVAGLVALALIWVLTGLFRHECGACGRPVRRWSRRCPHCGYDMRRRPAPLVSPGG